MDQVLYSATTVARFRWLLYELVIRDLKLRYRNSYLGFAWTILNPVLFMLVYTLVFSTFLRVSVPNFPLYLLAGLVAWNWITGAIPAAATAIHDGRMYVGKTVFPSELLVLVPILSNGVNFVLSLLLLLAFMPLLGGHYSLALTALPAVVAGELLVITGFSFLIATFNTFYRDLQQLINYLLLAGFFLTPIFYAASAVPPSLQFLVAWSPFAAIIDAYHSILYGGTLPAGRALGVLFAAGLLSTWLGIVAFDRYRDHFGDYL